MPDMPPPDAILIPTTRVYDIEQLEIENAGLKEFLVQLTQTVNTMSLVMNMKDSGYYFLTEIVNSQYYFPLPRTSYETIQEPRPVYRTTVWWNKPLPNVGTDTQAHNIVGIDANFRFTRIYGCASKPTVPFSYIPLPFASPTAGRDILLAVDATNVIITTAFNYSAYTSTFIVLEYIKMS